MSQTTPPPASAVRKLPVGATVLETYGRVLGKPGLLLRAVAAPFLLSVLLASVILVGRLQSPLVTLLFVLGFLPYALFGVAWHRVTLLGPVAGRPSLVSLWRRRHWRFLGYMVAVTLISYSVIMAAITFAINVTAPGDGEIFDAFRGGLLLAVLILAYLVTRLSFVFPAVAVDESYGLAHSWNHTRGQSIRLLSLLTLTALPLVALLGAIGWFFGDYILFGLRASALEVESPFKSDGYFTLAEDYSAENIIMFFTSECLIVALNYLLLAVLVSAISIAFRTCTGWVPAVSTPLAQIGVSD